MEGDRHEFEVVNVTRLGFRVLSFFVWETTRNKEIARPVELSDSSIFLLLDIKKKGKLLISEG